MKWLLTFLQWLFNKWIGAKPVSTPTNPTSIAVVTDVGAVAEGVGDVAKLGTEIISVVDSPEMIEARKKEALTKDRDRARLDAKQALQSGDASKVDADLS